jgi:hypothetical protein
MFNRPKKVLIGKNVAYTNAAEDLKLYVHGGATGYSESAIEGEITIFDEQFKVVADSVYGVEPYAKSIYIGQVLGDTYTFNDHSGVAVTGAHKIRFSDRIDGALIKKVTGKPHVAKGEQATVITTTLATTVGLTHVLRIVYRDLQDQKGGGQFVHSYRYTNVTNDTTDTINHALMTLVNKHAGARVVATHNVGTSLTLTGKPIPSCTTGLNDIDKFCMVEFDVTINYVDADGYFCETASTIATTAAVYGSGNWEQVRDQEREALGNKGITNLTQFPVIQPDLTVTKGADYDCVVIEHDQAYTSSDNQYVKKAPLTTIIYWVEDAAQVATFVTRLNLWLAGIPGAPKLISPVAT